jgi:chromosome segregation ATPase
MSNSLQLEEARSLLAQQRQIAEVTAPLVREAQEARDQATRALSEVTAQQRTLAQTQAALEASIAAQAAAATTPGAPPTDHSAETTTMRTQLAALQGQQGELAAVREELARVRTDAQAAQKQLRRDVLGATERGVAEVKQRIEATQAAAQAATDHAQRIAATLTPITEAQKGIVQELRKQESTQQAHAETLAREALERQALEQRLLTAGRALNAVEEQSTRTQQQLTEHIATAQRDAQKAAADKTALEEQLATLQRQMAALTRPTGEGPAENAELTARMVDLETEQARLKRQVEEAARAQAARDARAEQMARSLADLTHAKATQTREIAELRSRLGSTATREELAAVSQKVAALERESQSSRDTLRRQVAETVATIHTDQRRRAQREFFPEPPGGSPRGPVSPSRSSREGSSLGSFAGSAGGGALISYVAPTPTQLTTPVRREKPIRFATQTHTTSNMWKKRRPAPAPVHTPAPVLTDFKDAFEQAALRLRAPVAHRPEPEVGTADADHTALTKALRPAPSAPSHTVRKASPAQTFWTTATQARTPTQRAHAYRLVPYRPH